MHRISAGGILNFLENGTSSDDTLDPNYGHPLRYADFRNVHSNGFTVIRFATDFQCFQGFWSLAHVSSIHSKLDLHMIKSREKGSILMYVLKLFKIFFVFVIFTDLVTTFSVSI